jgi:hypothetical protein
MGESLLCRPMVWRSVNVVTALLLIGHFFGDAGARFSWATILRTGGGPLARRRDASLLLLKHVDDVFFVAIDKL